MTEKRNTKSPFDPLSVPCCCEGYPAEMCACGDEEKVLRFIKATDGRMDAEQRAWCVDQIRWVGDNTTQPTDAEIEAMSAKELARTTLGAWSDYVNSVT
jgi:hypothetical protein